LIITPGSGQHRASNVLFYGENPTIAHIPACNSVCEIATCEEPSLFVERRKRFQLPLILLYPLVTSPQAPQSNTKQQTILATAAAEVVLTEDVPGGALADGNRQPDELKVPELKRWLACWGASRTGLKHAEIINTHNLKVERS